MPIQFRCTSCSQPIEIDNEFAGQAVTCPYCEKVVTAPRPTETGMVIAASHGGSAGDGPPSIPQRPPEKGVLGWISLMCTVFAIVTIFVLMIAMYYLIGPFDKPLTPEESNRRLTEAMATRPMLRYAWLASGISICGLPVVGIVLAISSLVGGKRPRWPAILSLCLAVVLFAVLLAVTIAKVAGQVK